MLVGCCGFGSSGSSVVTDYLKEYNSFDVIDDFEYTLCYCPDGIRALDFGLNEFPSRNDFASVSLDRFSNLVLKKIPNSAFIKQSKIDKKSFLKISKKYIESLITLEWKGYNGTEFITCSPFYRKIGIGFLMQRFIPFYEKNKKLIWKKKYPYHRICLCSHPSDFILKTKQYNSSIINLASSNNSEIKVLDQPFPGDDPLSCMKYFDDPKCIIVDRDPRDTYIFIKTKLKHRGSFMPSDSVCDFVEYYKKIRNNYEKIKSKKNVLFIKFEDMVYKYDETTKKVTDFLGIGANPNPKTIFIPERSMANTQLFKRFKEFESDIKYIEKELSAYLYDFTDCKYLAKGDMFFGRSNINLLKNEKQK